MRPAEVATMPATSETPAELARLSDRPCVLVRRGGAPRKNAKCVVYWMQRAMRIVDNPALDLAIEVGNLLGLPVVAYFSAILAYPHASLRHWHFMAQGLRDVAEDAAERGVGFVLQRYPGKSLVAFLEGVKAALVVGDENPCREPERQRRALAAQLELPYWTVDADVVVPSRVFGRSFFLQHHFKPRLKMELTKYLKALGKIEPLHAWRDRKVVEGLAVDDGFTKGFAKLGRSVGPVDSFTGGSHAAVRRLKEFVHCDLAAYGEKRNHPEVKGTSRLSPYLHFGNIGPLTIALAVEDALKHGRVSSSARDRFLDQLIGWRELSVLFVRHNPEYDSWECAEPWAQKTLVEHAGDARPYRYSLEQMDRGETRDELWNAAQREMVDTGWMHNYMRMYWAKKILEWSPHPARAFQWAVTMNDRYELDGRDPNGYAGIAWAIVGKHDRPWFNRPVFGVVRPMSG
jgi:deoxyribodipyrimidine photo-lyase